MANFTTHNALPPFLQRAAYPETPWRLSPNLQQRIDQAVSERGLTYKRCLVLPADREWDLVWSAFHHDKPTKYGIKRVFCVYHQGRTQSFENNQQEMEAQTFEPNFTNDPHRAQRELITQRWRSSVAGQGHLEHVKVMPLWHGTRPDIIGKICDGGYLIPGHHDPVADAAAGVINDQGFFGGGMYFTTSAKYAVNVYSRDSGHVLLAWVSMRRPYSVVRQDMNRLRGQGAVQFYDAHYIPVLSTNRKNDFHTYYHPPLPGELPDCDEVVVFQRPQTLPTFWVELQPDLPFQPSPVPQSTGALLDFVMRVLQRDKVRNDPELRAALEERAGILLVLGDANPLEIEGRGFLNRLQTLFRAGVYVDRLVRGRLIGSPRQNEAPDRGRFNLVQERIDGGQFGIAWNILLQSLENFFRTANGDDLEVTHFYDVLEQLLPHLPLSARVPLFDRVLTPLRGLRMQQDRLLQLELSVVDWLISDEMMRSVHEVEWHRSIYRPAFEIFGQAIRLAIELRRGELPALLVRASDLFSHRLFKELHLMDSAIEEAIRKEDSDKLHHLLRQLALLRNTFCLTEEERNLLLPLFERISQFFDQDHPLPNHLIEILHTGLQPRVGDYPESFVGRYRGALNNWERAFASQELLTTFPRLLAELMGENGWAQGVDLQMAFSRGYRDPDPHSVLEMVGWFFEERREISLEEFATRRLVTFRNAIDVPRLIPMVEGIGAHLWGSGASEQWRLQLRDLLNVSQILRPLVEPYCRTAHLRRPRTEEEGQPAGARPRYDFLNGQISRYRQRAADHATSNQQEPSQFWNRRLVALEEDLFRLQNPDLEHHLQLGQMALQQHQSSKAITHLENALLIALYNENRDRIVSICHLLGRAHFLGGQYSIAVEYFSDALFALEDADPVRAARINFNMGAVYILIGNHYFAANPDAAYPYYQSALVRFIRVQQASERDKLNRDLSILSRKAVNVIANLKAADRTSAQEIISILPKWLGGEVLRRRLMDGVTPVDLVDL